jgi:hypothetical protein
VPQTFPDPNPSEGESFLIRFAVRFGWLLLIVVGVVVYRMFPNHQRAMKKWLLVLGFLLAAPMSCVICTGRAERIGDWGETIATLLLISFGLGLVCVITGAAFAIAESKETQRQIRLQMRAEREGAMPPKK